MMSNSRRSKAIAVGLKAPASDAGCSDSPDPAVGTTPTTANLKEGGYKLPAWMSERHAQALKGIPHQEAPRPDGAEKFMTVREAAAILRISERTTRRLLAEGKIRCIRVGRQIRIYRANLLKGI